MKKIMFVGGIVIALLAISSQVLAGEIIEDKVYTASPVAPINYETKVISQPITTILPAAITPVPSFLTPVINQVPMASTIKAENIIAGVFGNNTGGGNFSFPANLSVAGRISSGVLAQADGQITLYSGTENSDIFHIDNRTGSFRISKGISVGMVDLLTINGQFGSVGIGKTNLNPVYKLDVNGSIKANNYYAANGNIGLSNTYRLKANNGQNCFMTFNNGLLTNSDCPINSVLQESIK